MSASSFPDATAYGFGFGFSPTNLTGSFTLAIFISSFNDGRVMLSDSDSAVVVWCANRDQPVNQNATLVLTADGDLVLRDGDGRFVWSTNTSGHSVTRMNLTNNGNLLLLARDTDQVVWQSFDHPTDTWLNGQTLSMGKRLTSSVSRLNISSGDSSVFVRSDGLHAASPSVNDIAFFWNNSNSDWSQVCDRMVAQPFFHVLSPSKAAEIFVCDVDEYVTSDCKLPDSCGDYGICHDNTCSCPKGTDGKSNYFRQLDASDPSRGCAPLDPSSCNNSQKLLTFLDLEKVSYYDFSPILFNTDIRNCKQVCLEQCSCKAAIFRYSQNISSGNCSLASSTLLSLTTIRPDIIGYNAIASIKVQKLKNSSYGLPLMKWLLPSVLGGCAFLLLVIGACYYFKLQRKRTADNYCSPSSTLTRFSFETLRLATQDFQNKLGQGGFGSVFEGTLEDGKKVAVKFLDSARQGSKEFLAEVTTIGSIHHFNLVRLIGLCDERSKRLLVYEYMSNGSLDKWIFNKNLAYALYWDTRKRIIDGIAEGLEYLHEHCFQNIIHFDIKPQNILLDQHFNVKISDFGLAKIIDRDESQVMTIVRGTPGYMAPELITEKAISVKVDVYSFGVLVLEIVCGRKNSDFLQGECLKNLVKIKADEDQLSDLIEECDDDVRMHKQEAVKMLKIAVWCLQPHFMRPTMRMVVKVLQGVQDLEALTEFNVLSSVHEDIDPLEANLAASFRPTESILSGPR
ncbi:hypothetical protein Ancab_040173 [Ancistrocladus abbreviatus]